MCVHGLSCFYAFTSITRDLMSGAFTAKHDERLRVQGLFWLKKTEGGIWSLSINTWKKDSKMEPGSFQWCPVPGQEEMSTNWSTGSFLWKSDSISVLCWNGALAQVAQRLWHPALVSLVGSDGSRRSCQPQQVHDSYKNNPTASYRQWWNLLKFPFIVINSLKWINILKELTLFFIMHFAL